MPHKCEFRKILCFAFSFLLFPKNQTKHKDFSNAHNHFKNQFKTNHAYLQLVSSNTTKTTSNLSKPKTMAKKISLALTLKFKSFFPIQYKNYRY